VLREVSRCVEQRFEVGDVASADVDEPALAEATERVHDTRAAEVDPPQLVLDVVERVTGPAVVESGFGLG
jgi:hypothetical protein